jgi:hypothetical protein
VRKVTNIYWKISFSSLLQRTYTSPGIPVEKVSSDETERLLRMEGTPPLPPHPPHTPLIFPPSFFPL